MPSYGYKLSSEEHGPRDLVRNAVAAEDAGFEFACISDHYHPWVDKQGHSPFVWSVIGAIAQATEQLNVGTAVTCPTIRIHPAVIAQAAATSAAMLGGRFFLGLGSGENLNEHILADRWPPARVRLEMLEEAIEVIRSLWEGGVKSHYGKHYTVENARVYDLPEQPVPIYVAASGPRALQLAGRTADGFIGLAPSKDVVQAFEEAGGRGKPRYTEVTVCYASSEDDAKKLVEEWWPNAGVPGELAAELRTPAHFEQAAELVTGDKLAEKIPCGPDPDAHVEAIRKFVDAGYSHVFIHQVGPDQDGFFDFYRRKVLPAL